MRITKKEIAVITVLNFVIAALVAVFLYYRTTLFRPAASENDGGGITDGIIGDGNGNGDGSVNVDAPPVHEKLRAPSAGMVKEIAFEARLMGSGDESVVFSHTSGGVSYIFGNAAVPDYDFDGSGGFLCRVGSDGKILGFTYFDGKLTAAGVAEGGFVVATVKDAETSETSRLYAVDDAGNTSVISDQDGKVADIMPVGSKKMTVVSLIGSGTVKLTEFTRAGSGWAVGNSTRISSGLSIEYFDCYVLGEQYIISARAYSSPRYDAIVFYTFEAGGEAVPHYYGGNDESMLRPYAVLPINDGYLAVCDKNGEAAIVTLANDFTSYRRDMLKFKCTDAKLIYNGGKYYACFVTQDGAVTYELDKLLNRTTITAVSGSTLAAVVSMDSPLFVSRTDAAVTVTGERSLTLDIKGATVNRVFKTGYNELLIVLSARGGSALSTPTGGADVYVISIKL